MTLPRIEILKLAIPQFLLSMLLLKFPLLADFDYEFNSLLALEVLLLSAWFTMRSLGDESFSASKNIIRGMLIAASSLAGISIVIFFGHPRDYERGLLWWLLLPGTSWILGVSASMLIYTLFQRFRWIVFTLVMAGNFIWGIVSVITNSQIFVYSIFWGYFAGPIYDDLIPITDTLITHRIFVVALSILFILLTLAIKKRRDQMRYGGVSMLAVVFTLLLYIIYAQRDIMHWNTSYDFIQIPLGQKIEKQNLTLHFSSDISEDDRSWVFKLALFNRSKIERQVGVSQYQPITVYIYRDALQKKALMGAGTTNFAKIWNREVHINFRDVEESLLHEMTHVLAQEFGNRWIGTSKIGYLEGLAVAVEGDTPYFTPHKWAAILKKKNELPDIGSLVEWKSFWKSNSSLAYTISGSWVRFLMDRYGMDSFKRVYGRDEFDLCYPKPFDSIRVEWLNYLDSVSVRNEEVEFSQLLLQPGIFGRKNIHSVAEQLQKGDYYFTREDFVSARERYSYALQLDSNAWRARTKLWRSEYFLGNFDEIINLKIPNEIPITTRWTLALLVADAKLQLGNADTNCYDELSTQLQSPISLNAELRKTFIRDGRGSELQRVLRNAEPLAELKGIADYAPARLWLGRNYFHKGMFENARTALNAIVLKNPLLEKERMLILGYCELRAKMYDSAIGHFNAANVIFMDESITKQIELGQWLKEN